jgi:uncharacterized protein (DUF1778 family)
MKQKQFGFKLSSEQSEIIDKARKLKGMPFATFVRVQVLDSAKKIIKSEVSQ